MLDLLLFLHILGAATWLGANMAQMFLGNRYSREGGESAAAYWRAAAAMGVAVQTPAAVVLLLTGIGMLLTGDSPYGFASTFVSIGFLTIIVGAVLGSRFFGPRSREAAELHAAGKDDAATAVVRRIATVGSIDTLLVVIAIAAMVWKWGA